ncbi:MAG TPA: hypothetical protein VKV15_02235 [Bryobacteraceae bacterium]|nr:hypothetical protein [Bryobacteraceae bacterium]
MHARGAELPAISHPRRRTRQAASFGSIPDSISSGVKENMELLFLFNLSIEMLRAKDRNEL